MNNLGTTEKLPCSERMRVYAHGIITSTENARIFSTIPNDKLSAVSQRVNEITCG